MIDVKVLRAAGLTNDQIVAVVEADQVERKASRREQNRIAQRNHRARQQSSADCQQFSADMADIKKPNGINGHVSMTANDDLFLSKKDSKKERKKVERGRQLPETWVPSAKHFELGASLRMSREEVLFHAEAFREWAGANPNRSIGRKANWDLAFNGWLRRESANPKPRNEQRKGGLI